MIAAEGALGEKTHDRRHLLLRNAKVIRYVVHTCYIPHIILALKHIFAASHY